MWVVIVALEGGAVSRVVSGFSASKASSFPDAFFPFFFSKFFYVDGVDIHSVWINFWALVVSMVSLDWVGVIGFLRGNGIRSVPLGFEVDGTDVPVVDCGRDSVHSIDSFHEGGRDSS